MQWQFDYIRSNIKPQTIRQISQLDDESLVLVMAGLICKLVGGLKYVPNKRYKVELAKELIIAKYPKWRVLELAEIGERTYFNILKRIKDGKS
ncbi:resolvase [Campylobacter sp. faydin G-140]|uniref:resolvase n=1 Tax=Campylobacter anatolicus TaxID=2829105 RepID=UPI001B936D38|nr:resolvase [Campylobacter anatolicus]MBR8466188.1 resolvase [Campylobacter anatolicus]